MPHPILSLVLNRPHVAADPRYKLVTLRRVRVLGRMVPAGEVLLVPRLAGAMHLCRSGAARPADRHTALDVELGTLLDLVLPR